MIQRTDDPVGEGGGGTGARPSDRVRLAAGLLALAALVALAWCSRDPEPPVPRIDGEEARTVVLVVLDSVRADHTSLLGGDLPTTPSLDRLAADALVCGAHTAASDGANAALATLLTGLAPGRHRVGDLTVPGRRRLGGDAVTLAEILQTEGFATWGAAALPQLDAGLSGLARGFDVWRAPDPGAGRAAQASDALLDAHLPELEELLRTRPSVFALVHLADAHDPETLSPAARARFLHERLQPFTASSPELNTLLANLDEDPAATLSALEAAFARRRTHPVRRALAEAAYDAALHATDAGLGRIVALLEDTGRLDSALLVVVGARGWEPDRAPAMPPVEGILRTPLLVRPPGGVEPARANILTAAADVAPTVLELCGLADRLVDVDGTALVVDGAFRAPTPERIVTFESVLGGYSAAVSLDAVAWLSPPPVRDRREQVRVLRRRADDVAEREEPALVAALLAAAPPPTVTVLAVAPGGDDSWSVRVRALRGTLFDLGGERSGAELRADLSPAEDGDRLTVQTSEPATPLKLTISAASELDEERVWIGAAPLARVSLPRIADRHAPDWPTDEDGAPLPWEVDVTRERGTTFRVTVGARSGAAPDRTVEVLVATYPPRDPTEAIEVRALDDPAFTPPEIRPVEGRPDLALVRGRTPLALLVERRASETLALAVAVEGRQVAAGAMRLEGRRFAREGTLELYVPAWVPGVTPAFAARPADGSVPPGALLIRREGESDRPPADLSLEQLHFLRRLGNRQ